MARTQLLYYRGQIQALRWVMKSLESLGNESIGDNDLGLDKEDADPDEKAKVTKKLKKLKKLKDLKAKMAEELKHTAMPTLAFALKYLAKVFGDLTSSKFYFILSRIND